MTDQIKYYASTYCYIISFSLILQGSLRIFRSTLEGIKKSIWPLLSGVGELLARTLVCLLLPKLINPTDPVSNASYVGVVFSVTTAWFVSVIVMGFAVLYHIKKGVLKKEAPIESLSH